jgi:hypothetical protein
MSNCKEGERVEKKGSKAKVALLIRLQRQAGHLFWVVERPNVE